MKILVLLFATFIGIILGKYFLTDNDIVNNNTTNYKGIPQIITLDVANMLNNYFNCKSDSYSNEFHLEGSKYGMLYPNGEIQYSLILVPKNSLTSSLKENNVSIFSDDYTFTEIHPLTMVAIDYNYIKYKFWVSNRSHELICSEI